MTDVPMCRLPGANSLPVDEVFHAISLLTVAAGSLEAGPGRNDLLAVLEIALQTLQPVCDFLDKIDVPGELEIFQQCRIDAIR